MKLIKTASGEQTVKMSKSEWEEMGRKAGWIKEAKEASDKPSKTKEEIKRKCPKCKIDMKSGSHADFNADTGYIEHNYMYTCPKCGKME